MEKSSSRITTLTTRRPKWKYPQPQQTPRILHLPRRPRRKLLPPPPPPPPSASKPSSRVDRRGRLDSLFHQEREFKGGGPLPIVTVSGGVELERRRERVEERESKTAAAAAVEEEKWRFQAEMLRAECNLLRMEKEIGLNKMERRKAHLERTLQSAIHTLLSGRERICNGEDGRVELEEEIGRLVAKLEKLQRRLSSRRKDCSSGTESHGICVKEIQEMAEASVCIRTDDGNGVSSQTNFNIEILRRKMEGLSRGTLLERMEDEYGSMISSTANSSAASSASNSRRIELPLASCVRQQQPLQMKKSCKEEQQQQQKKGCGGSCKAIVRRVMEQVRAETEQWSQMQAMLGQVRDEMEQLQASRQFWEDRALDSDSKLQNLHSTVEEWRQKAISFEDKTKELEKEIHGLKKLKSKDRSTRGRNVVAAAASPQNETEEKRVLVCSRMKENRNGDEQQFRLKDMLREERRKSMSGVRSSPFRDLGNFSLPLTKQQQRQN